MGAKDLSSVFQIGVDILSTFISSTTKKILANTGSIGGSDGDGDGNEIPDQDNVGWWQHVGFASRPPKPQKGKAACQAVIVRRGDYDVAIATQDLRGLELYGNLADGETCLYAPGEDGNGQARVLLKKDGSINLYTRKGNSKTGVGMMIQIDAAAGAIRLLNDKGYGLIIDQDGCKLTAGDAALQVLGNGNCSLIGKGKCQIDGSGICLGSTAVPGVNAVLVGVTGLVGVASTKVLCALA